MIPLLVLAALAQVTGTWVFESGGRNALVLSLDSRGGTLVRPKTFRIDSEGELTEIGGELTRIGVKFTKNRGEFRAGNDLYRIEPAGPDRADLAPVEVPWLAIRLRRAQPAEDPTVATDWPQPTYAPEIVEVQERIKAMVDADQAVRVSPRISLEAMGDIDERHRPEVERVFERYGWPKRSIFGRMAAHQFWLLVQHQPLEVQQRMLPEMEIAAQQGEASGSDYAYLYDRVQTGQGKAQRWGTQAKCVNGLPVLFPVEDRARLDDRRRELRMPPIAVYLRQMRDQCRATR